MQLFFRLVPPPHAHCSSKKSVTLSKIWHGCRHAYRVSALGMTCVTPPLKNPASPLTLDAKFTINCISLLLTLRANGLMYFN